MKSDFFIKNRQELLTKLGHSALVVLRAHTLMQRSRDQAYPFEQDKSFWYYSGVEEPNFTMVISPDASVLIAPRRSRSQVLFDGKIDIDQIGKLGAFDKVMDQESGQAYLKSLLAKHKSLHTLFPPKKRHQNFTNNPNRQLLRKLIYRLSPSANVIDISPTIARQRAIKQPIEIKSIQNAVNITISGISQIISKLDSLKSEKEIEQFLTQHFTAHGVSHAFDPIIASGKNATTLHYTRNNSKLNKGDLVLLDVGARFGQYNADISRTIPNGKISPRQQQVLSAVKNVQDRTIASVKPGLTYVDIEKLQIGYMGQALNELGLINDAKNHNKIRQFYPHMGHFLGLDVHDVGDIFHFPLEPGAVITIEPGIYIEQEGVGVRIEDDIVVTKDGCKVLSKG